MASPFPNVKELEAILGHHQVLQPGQPHERLAGGGKRAGLAMNRCLFHGLSRKATKTQNVVQNMSSVTHRTSKPKGGGGEAQHKRFSRAKNRNYEKKRQYKQKRPKPSYGISCEIMVLCRFEIKSPWPVTRQVSVRALLPCGVGDGRRALAQLPLPYVQYLGVRFYCDDDDPTRYYGGT